MHRPRVFPAFSCCVLLLLLLLLLPPLPLHAMHPEASAFLHYVSSNFSSFFTGAALDVVRRLKHARAPRQFATFMCALW
jgi:hypothetical protein